MKLIIYPNKILTKQNEMVAKDTLPSLSQIQEMERILDEGQGVGLAAPQIGINLRFFIVRYNDLKLNVINPETIWHSKEMEKDEEGCLSLPDVSIKVNRYKSIKIKWLDENWQEHEELFDGFVSRIFQHEGDHLNGILLTHRMSNTDKIRNRKVLRVLKYMSEQKNIE